MSKRPSPERNISDKGPLLEMLDLTFHVTAVCFFHNIIEVAIHQTCIIIPNNCLRTHAAHNVYCTVLKMFCYIVSVKVQFFCLPIGQNRITCRSTKRHVRQPVRNQTFIDRSIIKWVQYACVSTVKFQSSFNSFAVLKF